MDAWTRWIIDHRRKVLALWVVLFVLGAMGAANLGDLLTNRFSVPGSEAEKGRDLLSDRLGERFSANGDIIAFALGGNERVNAVGVGHPPKFVGNAVGACVAGQIELTDCEVLERSMILQEGVLPSALAPLLPVFFIAGGRILGAAQSLIKGVYHGPLSHLHTFFVVSHDDAGGRIALNEGKAEVRWAGAGDQPVVFGSHTMLRADSIRCSLNVCSSVVLRLMGNFPVSPAFAHD